MHVSHGLQNQLHESLPTIGGGGGDGGEGEGGGGDGGYGGGDGARGGEGGAGDGGMGEGGDGHFGAFEEQGTVKSGQVTILCITETGVPQLS